MGRGGRILLQEEGISLAFSVCLFLLALSDDQYPATLAGTLAGGFPVSFNNTKGCLPGQFCQQLPGRGRGVSPEPMGQLPRESSWQLEDGLLLAPQKAVFC